MMEVNFMAAAGFLIAVYYIVKAAVKSGMREAMGMPDEDEDELESLEEA